MSDQKEYYKITELAEKLDVSSSHIRNLVNANALPHIRLGTSLRFPKKQMDEYLTGEWQNSLNTVMTAGTSTMPTEEPDGAENFQRALETAD